MKPIVTLIPTDLDTNLVLSLFYPFLETKKGIAISASRYSGYKKYFCFLCIASWSLIQIRTKFNKLL